MKTALTELLEDLNSMKNSEVLGIAKDAIHECIIATTSYLQTEKQQIIDAWIDGDARICQTKSIPNAQDYYTSTFTTNKETLK